MQYDHPTRKQHCRDVQIFEMEQDAHSLHMLTDAVIWGRRTYEGMASYWLTVPGNPASTPAELEHARFLDAATKIVVSRTLERVAWNNA